MLFSVDCETTGLNPHTGDRAFLIAWCNEYGGTGHCFVGIDSFEHIKDIVTNPANEVIGHNIGFDLAFLRQLNLDIKVPMHDTVVMAHLHNPLEPTKKLKPLAKKYLKRENTEEDAVLHWFATNGMRSEESRRYIDVPEALILPYAIADVVMTMDLFKFYRALGVMQSPVYATECALIRVCADICRQGMKVDSAYAKQEAERTTIEAGKELVLLQGTYGIDNPGSGDQVAAFIKREIIPQQGLKIEDLPKTDGGDLSTDADALVNYDHPAIDHILQYRALLKMNGTYLQAMLTKTDANGFIHSSLNQTGAKTGRMSAHSPNLENLPRSGGVVDIRRGFICNSPDHVLLFVDLSQIELRMLTHYTEDPDMMEALCVRGGDLHAATAELLFQSREKKYRTIAKTLNFAIIYSAGAEKLLKTLNKTAPEKPYTLAQVREFKRGYYERFPRVRQLQQYLEALVMQRGLATGVGYITGVSGRRQFIESKYAYRATNALCQGESAMLFKRKAIELSDMLRDTSIKICNLVHDEFVFSMRREDMRYVGKILRCIEDAPEFRVPIFANVAVSETNWADKKDISYERIMAEYS